MSQKEFFNPLDAVTPLGVKRYSVRNAMINIKDISKALKKKYHLAPKGVHGVQRVKNAIKRQIPKRTESIEDGKG
jgi:hypothetical protein